MCSLAEKSQRTSLGAVLRTVGIVLHFLSAKHFSVPEVSQLRSYPMLSTLGGNIRSVQTSIWQPLGPSNYTQSGKFYKAPLWYVVVFEIRG